MSMRIGRMDRKVTLQEPVASSSDYNDPRDATWTNLSDNPQIWAEKVPMRGREGAEAGKESALSVVRWRIRYRSDVTEKMRLQHDSKNYYITMIN